MASALDVPFSRKTRKPKMTRNIPIAAIAACLLLPSHSPAQAAENKYQVTDAEQAACGPDVISLCGNAGEDEDKILTCMKGKRADLSAECRVVFDECLLRRGLR
ncbi:hypothetical protein [Lichenifustis flavocetrariae]|uniref:Cysteine rich repeat-containing protein n=1 Tax=Lichenifustis flavocetrariae TaxID=2949735 RepID=A0AA41YW07_9HYPH|nr:hypothetical protein [Lichenifustis flavocetrariae]MCW6509644.1 hypothetical protein [Lichenifustis flavocetrariae]